MYKGAITKNPGTSKLKIQSLAAFIGPLRLLGASFL